MKFLFRFSAFLLIVVFSLSMFQVSAASAQAETASFCHDWKTIYGVFVTDPEGGSKTVLTADQRTRLESWLATTNFFLRSGTYYQPDFPSDTREAWRFVLTTETGTHWMFVMLSPSQPQTAYVYTFDDLAITTDEQGNHEGLHHFCGTDSGDKQDVYGGHFTYPASTLIGIVPNP